MSVYIYLVVGVKFQELLRELVWYMRLVKPNSWGKLSRKNI